MTSLYWTMNAKAWFKKHKLSLSPQIVYILRCLQENSYALGESQPYRGNMISMTLRVRLQKQAIF